MTTLNTELVYTATGKKSRADVSKAAKAALALIKAGWDFQIYSGGIAVTRATLRYIGAYDCKRFSQSVAAELIKKGHIAGRAKTEAELNMEEFERQLADWQESQWAA